MFASQHGDVYVWQYRGDPAYRLHPFNPRPVELTTSMARRFPSRLLASRYEVVDLVGRSQELDRLTEWAGGPAPVAVRAVHGVGGQGKTRLASSFAREMSATGWTAVSATHRRHLGVSPSGGTEVATEASGTGLLVVIDYAERWPATDLHAVLNAHLGLGGPLRVLLLSRDLRGWWRTPCEALLDHGVEQVDDVALLPLAEGLAGEGSDAESAFWEAATAFADRLGLEDPPGVSLPRNVSELGRHTLTLHMAALASVDAVTQGSDPPAGPAALSAYLLHRERRGWAELSEAGRIASTARRIGHASLVAALTQALPYEQGIRVVRATGIAESDAEADEVLDDHQVAYPIVEPGTVLEPLAPDRLAEDYVALSVSDGHDAEQVDPDLADPWAVTALTRLLESGIEDSGDPAANSAYSRSVMTVLVAAASRWPHLPAGVLWPLLKEHPPLVLAGGAAAVAGLASLAGSDADLLDFVYRQLPSGSHLEFDQAATFVAERRAELISGAIVGSAKRAGVLAALGYRYGHSGHRKEALAPTQEAVEIYRGLADPETGNPAAYLPDLAGSLNNLGSRLSEAGSRKEALAPTQEAVEHLPGLADPETGNPAAYLPDLAMSLNNLGIRLSRPAAGKEALAPTQEAVEIRRGLADPETGNPAAYLPDLAMSLNNLGTGCREAGQPRGGAGPDPGGRRPSTGPGRPRDRQPRRVPARPRDVAEQPGQPAVARPAAGRRRWPRPRRPSSIHRAWPTRAGTPPPTCPTSRCR